jgi:hypothetical protein
MPLLRVTKESITSSGANMSRVEPKLNRLVQGYNASRMRKFRKVKVRLILPVYSRYYDHTKPFIYKARSHEQNNERFLSSNSPSLSQS